MSAKHIILFALVAAATGEHVSPIQKVIQLLSELEAKIMAEGEAEEKAFKEFFEWCDDAARNKKFEIKTATSQKEKLEATISKATSDAASAADLIEELSASISTNEADLKAATEIRKKESEDFLASEAELADAVDTLERAIAIIDRNMKGSALVQTPVDSSDLQALLKSLTVVIDAAAFSNSDKQKLLELMQSRQSDDEDAELGAPAPDTYKSHSGGIMDVLTDMKDKAEAQLSELRKAEKNSAHNFEMLKLSLTDEVAAATKELEEEKANKAEAEQTNATAEADLALTLKDLAEAESAMSTVGSDCMTTAQDHEVSKNGRAEELKVLATAKKIIQSSTAGASGQTYSLLQIASSATASSKLRTGADLRNFEVVKALKLLAARQHSTDLAQLASRVAATIRYGAASGDDPFAKVKGLITDMIEKLMNEAAAEASFKAYCDEEMSKTKAKKEELNGDIKKLTSKIDLASANSADLKEQVKELQKELADLAAMQAEMDKVREDSHAAFVQTKAELEEGITGVEGALKVLRDYYGASEEALLQQPAPPEGHSKASGAGGSIIDFLEVILSDFSKNLAEEETEEATAQTDYDKLTQQNKITKATKQQDVKYKTQEFQKLDTEIAELTGDRNGAQTELDAVLEYYEKIKDECIAKPEPYEERKRRREEEIAGLKEALSILEGQSFLQKSLRGVRSH